MLVLNDDDLLLIKYMALASFRINKANLNKTKNFDELMVLLQHEFSNEEVANDFIKEALYHINCFNILHIKDGCPKEYKECEWGKDICDEIILFVRLFQQLDVDEFANMLETCTNTTLEEFKYLEFDYETLDEKTYIEDIISWLENHNNSFADDIRKMLQLRKMNSNSNHTVTKSMDLTDLNDQKDNSITTKTKDTPPVDNFKGICLVISNETFDKLPKNTLEVRNGTKIDEKNIQETFGPLGYDVKICCDVNYVSLKGIIEDIKKEVKVTHRLLMVFILSHGKEKCFFTTDNHGVPFEEVWRPFSNENFNKFVGKAKLFFFVCCQGDDLNLAIKVPTGSNVEFDGPLSLRQSYPAMANFFFGYSTCEPFLSCRTAKCGTYYVDCLCKVVRDNPDSSIIDIHQEVQRLLSGKLVKLLKKKQEGFQMPYFTNILTDNISFIDSEDE